MSWLDQAACRDMDTRVFFPWDPSIQRRKGADRTKAAEALAVCDRCPVRQECLDDALATDGFAPDGIRGGLTPRERAELVDRPAKAALRPHGTHAAAQRHKAAGEPLCPACRHGEAQYQRARYDRKRAS